MSDIKLTIGQAAVTIGGVEAPHLADAVSFSAEPILYQVDLYNAPNYDQVVQGWNVSCTLVVDEESYEGYMMALAGAVELHDESAVTTPLPVSGISDDVGNKRLRANAKEVVIHPEGAEDKKYDITIFKAVPVGAVERQFGKEKTTYEIQLTGLHRTGDHTVPKNYFMIGEDKRLVQN